MENESRIEEGKKTEGKPTIVSGTHSNGAVISVPVYVKGGKPTIDLDVIVFKGAENPTHAQILERAKENSGCANVQIATAVAVRLSFTEVLENCPLAE